MKRQPVGLRRNRLLAVDVTVFREQIELPVGVHRGVELGLPQQGACERAPAGQGDGHGTAASSSSAGAPASAAPAEWAGSAASTRDRRRRDGATSSAPASGEAAGCHGGIGAREDAQVGKHADQLFCWERLRRRAGMCGLHARGDFRIGVVAHVRQNRRPGRARHGRAVAGATTCVVRPRGRQGRGRLRGRNGRRLLRRHHPGRARKQEYGRQRPSH